MMTLPILLITLITLRTGSCFTRIMKASNAKCSRKPCLPTPLRYGRIPLLQALLREAQSNINALMHLVHNQQTVDAMLELEER